MGTVVRSLHVRLLCIEDDPEVRRLLFVLLKRRYPFNRVVVTGDGFRAVALMKRHRVDLLLLDLFMPRLDGFAILEMLSDKENVVVVSAASRKETEVLVRLERLGVRNFVPKPIDLPLLFLAIEGVLERKEGPEPSRVPPPRRLPQEV